MSDELHPAHARLLRYFTYAHLPPALQEVSKACGDLAELMVLTCADSPDSAEVTVGLRKLLEAKDCFVRAMVP